MKLATKFLIAAIVINILSACTFGNGRICGPQTPIAYCNKESYEKLNHPKAYGEYWTKPGITKESWRKDWVTCGGKSNGQYSGDAPSGSTSEVLNTAWKIAKQKLDTCMRSKGYEYHYSGVSISAKE